MTDIKEISKNTKMRRFLNTDNKYQLLEDGYIYIIIGDKTFKLEEIDGKYLCMIEKKQHEVIIKSNAQDNDQYGINSL